MKFVKLFVWFSFNICRTVELVQEPLAVDTDVKKAIKTSKHWTLKNFRATQVKKTESVVAGSLVLLQDKRAADIHEGFQLDPSSRLARTSKDVFGHDD